MLTHWGMVRMKKLFYCDVIELILVLPIPQKILFLACDIYVTINIATMWENISNYLKVIKINKNNNKMINRKIIKKISF